MSTTISVELSLNDLERLGAGLFAFGSTFAMSAGATAAHEDLLRRIAAAAVSLAPLGTPVNIGMPEGE